MNKKEYKELQKSGKIELAAMKFIEENNGYVNICKLYHYLCNLNKNVLPYLYNIVNDNNIDPIYQARKINRINILSIISNNNKSLNLLEGNNAKSILLIADILASYIFNDKKKNDYLYISSSLDDYKSYYISYEDCSDIETRKYLCDNINIYITFSSEKVLPIGLIMFYFPDPINDPARKEIIFAKCIDCINLISNKDMSIYNNPDFINNSFIISCYTDKYFK